MSGSYLYMYSVISFFLFSKVKPRQFGRTCSLLSRLNSVNEQIIPSPYSNSENARMKEPIASLNSLCRSNNVLSMVFVYPCWLSVAYSANEYNRLHPFRSIFWSAFFIIKLAFAWWMGIRGVKKSNLPTKTARLAAGHAPIWFSIFGSWSILRLPLKLYRTCC